ncbi:MAG: YncE family protein, partial [Acidimicrobiaceae bacterium]
ALWVAQSIADKVIRVALGSSSVAHSVAALIAQSREQSVISSSINSINVGSRPAGLKMSADGRFLFVVNENDDTMTKIDIGSSGETWTFRISNQPRELSLDETANRIYISGIFSNSIAVVQIPETVVPAPVANLPIPVEVSPPAVGTPSPSVQSPTSGSSQTTVVISPQVKIGRTISSKSLVGVAKIPLKAGSTIRLRVMQSSAKFCKVTGSSLRGMKAGTCKVAVTVTPKKGRTTSKTVTVRVLK